MSEYWKSTPRYWCKFCELFVRDTKLEKQQHDATLKHQNAIQRSLRKLHNQQERDERNKQRAKDEVARLSAMVSGTPAPSSSKPTSSKPTNSSSCSASAKATPEERKRQVSQLAAMGIQIPDEFRGEMALAGEWKTVSHAVSSTKNEEDFKPAVAGMGGRKRKYEDEQDPEHALYLSKGMSERVYPGSLQDDRNLDDLLSGIAPKKKEESATIKTEGNEVATPTIKKEEVGEEFDEWLIKTEGRKAEEDVKTEESEPGAGIIFKKRKKPVRPI